MNFIFDWDFIALENEEKSCIDILNNISQNDIISFIRTSTSLIISQSISTFFFILILIFYLRVQKLKTSSMKLYWLTLSVLSILNNLIYILILIFVLIFLKNYQYYAEVYKKPSNRATLIVEILGYLQFFVGPSIEITVYVWLMIISLKIFLSIRFYNTIFSWDKFYLCSSVVILLSTILTSLLYSFTIMDLDDTSLQRIIPVATTSLCTLIYVNSYGSFEIIVKIVALVLSFCTISVIKYSKNELESFKNGRKHELEPTKTER